MIICTDYRAGVDGPNRYKDPPKDILHNEKLSYIFWLRRIGLKENEITVMLNPMSQEISNYIDDTDHLA